MFGIFKSAAADATNRLSGKTDLLEAGLAIAARVAAADGKIEDDEIIGAVEATQQIDSLKAAFTASQIEAAAEKQFGRAKSILGRSQLKKEIEDIAKADIETRQFAFLIGAMAAEAVGGIGPEERKVLDDAAKVLSVNANELLAA